MALRKESGKGIVFILDRGVVVKKPSLEWLWRRCKPYATRGYTRIGAVDNRKVPYLRVWGADVTFPAWAIEIALPGFLSPQRVFGYIQVLEIRNLQDRVLWRNPLLCLHCGTITGQSDPLPAFRCWRCGHRWHASSLPQNQKGGAT